MRLRPRSIRARDTVIATVISACAVTGVAAGMDLIVRQQVSREIWAETDRDATRVVAALRADPAGRTVLVQAGGFTLIQVVNGDGRVLRSTPDVFGLPPMSTTVPSADDPIRRSAACPSPVGRCVLLTAIRAGPGPGSSTVYAGHETPVLLRERHLELLLAAMIIPMVGLASWVTWHMVGRTFRPIEQIRLQLAEISDSDLSRRLSEPKGQSEIALLVRTANETLDRLERAVEQQRRFASDASHELRTPIAGLRANLEDAAAHPEDTDLVTTVKSALRDTDRLESIVTDLLLLARLGTSRALQEVVDLGELARQEIELRRQRVHIETHLPPGVVVQAVSVQMRRLLANLLDNAERYAQETVTVGLRRDDDTAVLTVTDDGIGIAPEDRERVFERFTRLDSSRGRETGGTGLGLSIARDIAVAHGGGLRIEDSPRGARFALRLPLLGTEQAQHE